MKTNLLRDVRMFVEAKCGKGCYGVFTGYTLRAYTSYVYLVDAWLNGDRPHRDILQDAMAMVLRTLQPSELQLAKWAIAGVGDYGHIDVLWPIIAPRAEPRTAKEMLDAMIA